VDMENRNIVVTGGASGIGRATVFLLARNGARVFVGDVDAERGAGVAADAAAQGFRVEYFPLELTDHASIDGFADAVHARAPRLDALVNAAGWDIIQPFMDNDAAMWDRVIAINLMGAVRLTRNVLRPKKAEKSLALRPMPGVSAAWARPSMRRQRGESSRSQNPWRARWRGIGST